jgi:hypothetical protein
MLGSAAVAIWFDVTPAMKAELEDWHSHEHMPERVGIPGFLRGTRSIALSGAGSYFVLYEAAELATVTSGAYLERLNNPTPWSRKMMPHHLNVVRSLCRVRASAGGGLAHAVATIRFSPAQGRAESLALWLAGDVLPALPRRPGLTGAHLLESEPAERTPPTAEQKIRGGGDVRADRVLLVCGYDAEAVEAAAGQLAADALAAHGASPNPVCKTYRVAYSLRPKDLA